MTPARSRRHGDLSEDNPLPKVLLVDSQPLQLMFTAAELEDMCQPILASSGEEALSLARLEQPGLILLGVHLPDMDGFEVCRQLKAGPATADITVIFLTALDEAGDEALGLNLGAIDYITKPFSPAILRARVRNQLLNLRQRQQLERIAQIDPLTGIANRRSFDECLQMTWQAHALARQPLGLLMMDIDHFKAYNDCCGHPAGDLALQQVAQCLTRQMQRQSDLLVRYGGEEFACVLPHTDLAGALQIGRQLCAAVVALQLPHPASTVGPWVSISVGAYSCVPQPGQTADELLRTADQALYLAKSRGRNQAAGPGES